MYAVCAPGARWYPRTASLPLTFSQIPEKLMGCFGRATSAATELSRLLPLAADVSTCPCSAGTGLLDGAGAEAGAAAAAAAARAACGCVSCAGTAGMAAVWALLLLLPLAAEGMGVEGRAAEGAAPPLLPLPLPADELRRTRPGGAGTALLAAEAEGEEPGAAVSWGEEWRVGEVPAWSPRLLPGADLQAVGAEGAGAGADAAARPLAARLSAAAAACAAAAAAETAA